jgi:outer membrane receptor protein involved in Fe transport
VGANEISDLYSSLIRQGYRRSNRVEVSNLTGTLDATATLPLSESLVSTTSLGSQYTREEYHDNRAFGRGVAPGTKSLNGVASLFSVGESNVENATLGTYGQQQLAWNDRLFVTAALRGDENSAFGTDAGFAWYPSLSASWVVSDEPFFPELGFLDNLRFRAAYGKSGLRPSFRDALTYYEPSAVRLSGTEAAAVTLGGTGNPDLRPEVATEVELGFDLGLLGERLGLEFTYYDKRSQDALVRRRLAPSLGLTTTTWDNVGEVSNRGLEAAVNARLLDLSRVQWEMSVTASRNDNELIELGEGIEPILMGSNRVQQRHTEGYPLGGYWLRPVTYADANGDGLLQTDEVTIGDEPEYMGQPIPTREASLSTSFTLFNLVRLSGMLDYKGGHRQMNFTRFDRCAWEVVCPASYILEESNLRDQAGVISFWEEDVTSLYLEKADFVKLRELAVSVSAPDRLTSRFGLGGLRLTVSGRNLKTWTDYSGFDPEVNSFGVFDQGFQTYDYYTQPPLRYYTARIDVNF